MSRIKSHLMCNHFKKYSGVPFYFKTSRKELQPWTKVLEKNSPFLRFDVALEIVSIDIALIIPTLNGDTRETSPPGGGTPPQYLYGYVMPTGS